MKQTLLKSDLKLKDGTTYNKGSSVTVMFNTDGKIELCGLRDTPIKVSARGLANHVQGFSMPSMASMERWVSNGVSKSVTGGRCEPDGYSCDGAPSWLLVLGMI